MQLTFFIFGSVMTEFYDAACAGDLERVILLVEQGEDKNQVDGTYRMTVLI